MDYNNYDYHCCKPLKKRSIMYHARYRDKDRKIVRSNISALFDTQLSKFIKESQYGVSKGQLEVLDAKTTFEGFMLRNLIEILARQGLLKDTDLMDLFADYDLLIVDKGKEAVTDIKENKKKVAAILKWRKYDC